MQKGEEKEEKHKEREGSAMDESIRKEEWDWCREKEESEEGEESEDGKWQPTEGRMEKEKLWRPQRTRSVQ